MYRRLIFRLVGTCLLTMAGAAHAGGFICVGGLSCEETIQGAVDRANPGDVIEISPRPDGLPRVETVTITTAGLTIRGSEPVAFDIDDFESLVAVDWVAERAACSTVQLTSCGAGGSTDCSLPYFRVEADDVTIEGLTLLGSSTGGIEMVNGAAALTLDSNCFIGRSRMVSTLEETPSHNLVVTRNRAFGLSSTTTFHGDGTRVELNLLNNTDGIRLQGDDTTAHLNAVYLMTDNEPIEARGSNATITSNYLRANDDAGIMFSGVGATIADNLIDGAVEEWGIHIRAPSDFDSEAADQSDQVTIRNNEIIAAGRSGIELRASNSIVEGNSIERSGTPRVGGNDELPSELARLHAGIWIRGSDNTIENNVVTLAGTAGIKNGDGVTPSDRNVFQGNRVSFSAMNGLLIYAGDAITVSNNELIDNDGEGLATNDRAGAITVEGNLLQGNRLDLCNCGAELTLTSNSFDSGGPTADCIVAREPGSSCPKQIFRAGFEDADLF
ncbi:MAG: right-handed parallel beta-helix repeat-containing protein [Pseudomonadota bacterium]